MSSLPKRRRVKRATLLTKRSQLTMNDIFKQRSYKPLYEKLKANNNALAKALSQEKQECKYLVSQKNGLTSELQDLKVACNKRDDVISGALKNAKETLQLLITMSNCVANTIASCQQIVMTGPPRKSTASRRESSTRQLSGKSPARGVVQPMVSGHTITKPTINLSRLNLQREYRVQNPPNLSDIEESTTPLSSPEMSGARTASDRIPIARPLNYCAPRINRLPERLQNSMRASDENERRSSIRSNRNSSRRSAQRSRENSTRLSLTPSSRRSNQATTEIQTDEYRRNPRVALHDVSRLLHNSQSVNIRTLLENSTEIHATSMQSDESSRQMNATTAGTDSREIIADSAEDPESDKNVTTSDPNNSDCQQSEKKSRTSRLNQTEDDPLEGPSWLLNSTQDANKTSPAINNSSNVIDSPEQSINRTTTENDRDYNEAAPFVNSRSRNPRLNDEKEVGNSGDSNNEDDDKTTNLTNKWTNLPSDFFKNLNNDDDDGEETTNFSRFVTRNRGSTCNDDDFTLMIKRKDNRKIEHNINDFLLPVLESPIVAPTRTIVPEPERTANIPRITTHNFGNITLGVPRLNIDETVFDQTGVMLPLIDENVASARPSTVTENNSDEEDISVVKKKPKGLSYKRIISKDDSQSDSEDALALPDPTMIVEQESDDESPRKDKRKRKRTYKIRGSPSDSPSDSEWAPTPKRKNVKQKRNPRVKDPSSVKVVLQKLNDTRVKKRPSSPDPRVTVDVDNRRTKSTSMPKDAASDSDGGSCNASNNKLVSGRPRRQKAPTNLQEPSLGKKMRRN